MKPSTRSLFCWIAALLAPMAAPVWAAPADAPESPPRLLVLSDIEADPDDTQSFVRLFLYANEIELQGLVATTSVWKRDSIAPESMHALIDAYAKVHGNLLLHDKRYPTAETLHGLVRKGRPEYGMLGVGDGKDTEGSARIIELLDRADDRPLWVSVWGGANTLAQALHSLRATRSPAEVDRLVAKLRVYTISDQDDSGPWLRANFPGLFYIVTPGGDYNTATWTGIHTVVEGIDNTTISNRWLAENLQQGHGPLGAAYPDVAWGVEGDTPAFLGLVPNGLNAPEHPEWGGWGGRYTLQQPVVPIADEKTFLAGKPIPQETRPIWTNAVDAYAPTSFPEYGRSTRLGEKSLRSAQASLWRWRDEFQRDFAARMDWTVRPFAAANHPPVPVLDRGATVTVSSGQSFGFDARRSHDPDGDSLSFLWMPYREAGSSDAVLKINGTENAVLVALTAPEVTKTETCHLILKVTDRGTPALTRYQRIVVTVTPRAN